MTKDTDVAYIAGILDGEGYIGIKRDSVRKDCVNRSYHARIQVRMVDEPAISFLAETLGGNYYREKASAANGRPLFCFQASDASAETILRTVLPYLRVKRGAADIVLELRRLQSDAAKHKTKVVGYRNFPNRYGTVRQVPNLAYSDEYIAECDRLWLSPQRSSTASVSDGGLVTTQLTDPASSVGSTSSTLPMWTWGTIPPPVAQSPPRWPFHPRPQGRR